MSGFSYTALVPHRDVVSALAAEQAEILAALSRPQRPVFRFLPLCLFLPLPLEDAGREFADGCVIMPPAAGTGLVVYPVGAAGGVQPVVPAFLPVKDAELPGGVIAAFSPLPDADRAQSQARLDRLGIKEKRVRVFSLCEIHFSVRGAFPRDSRGALSWDWAETQRRWVKA